MQRVWKWVKKKAKKQVLSSLQIHTRLKKIIGQNVTGFFEIHLIPILSILLKWVLFLIATHPQLNVFDSKVCWAQELIVQEYFFVVEWIVDIVVPIWFRFKVHSKFEEAICFTFDRPIDFLAKQVQKIRPGNPAQLYKIKYYGMCTLFVYIGCVIQLLPVSNTLIYTCCVQTLIIQLYIDWTNNVIHCPTIQCNCFKMKRFFPNKVEPDIGDSKQIQLIETETKNKKLTLDQILKDDTLDSEHFQIPKDLF